MPEVSQKDIAEMWYRRYQELWRDYERVLGEVRRLKASGPDGEREPRDLRPTCKNMSWRGGAYCPNCGARAVV